MLPPSSQAPQHGTCKLEGALGEAKPCETARPCRNACSRFGAVQFSEGLAWFRIMFRIQATDTSIHPSPSYSLAIMCADNSRNSPMHESEPRPTSPSERSVKIDLHDAKATRGNCQLTSAATLRQPATALDKQAADHESSETQ